MNRLRRCFGTLAAAMTMVVYGAAGAPLIERSLETLGQAPGGCPGDFSFIVTGDSHSNRQLVYQTDMFKNMIQEWNLLQPSLVIMMGDLVLGGSAENVPQQWDLFEQTIAVCKPPYFSAPGNHDISDAASEKLWVERMGPTHYAFTCGNSRFIVLDSEEVDASDHLSDAQVAWFKQELVSTKAENIFVFLHQPYFTDEADPRTGEEVWQKRWQYLADIMHGHPVRAVFAGHIHGYRDFGVRDGVHYVIAGGAASLGSNAGPDGRFNHYLLVRVRGEQVTWSVIKPGAVLPPDVATNDYAAEMTDIQRRLVFCDEIPVPFGQPLDKDITIRIENPFDKPFDSSLSWEIPGGWKVEPLARDYHVDANGKAELAFHVSADGPGAVRFPVPTYKTRYVNTKYGQPADISVELPLVPVGEVAPAAGAVKIDGVLEEWKTAKPVPVDYPSGFQKGTYDPADLSGQCRIMYDDKNLYVSFDITDNDHCQPYGGDIVWLADAVELGINRWGWGFSLTKSGPEVFLYKGEGNTSAETVNKDVPLAVRRESGHTVYEAAFPAAMIEPLVLKAGSEFRFRAQVADLDNSGAKHSLSLSPGGDWSSGIKMVLTR
jgi:3',5'-cyclic AMP phosphodiesterase CpdA